MQIKTIKSVLAKKIQSWAGSITDPAVKKIVEEQTIVTGGAIASMLMQEPVNDYDVYFRTGEGAFAVAQYYVNKMNEAREKSLDTPQEALHAMMSKTLHYVGSLYPICSVIRTRKFIQREWRITAGQYLKMAFQISDLNLRDVRVLEDQLTGVDSAFFAQLIGIVRKDVEEGKKPEDIDVTYIAQLVDRIF